ncbi:MAG: hypothetical protein IJH76_03445 [Clostridia bacterium]|nr:hypothetical protein [Clostridia bacterium]
MTNDIEEKIKDTELFMLAQFIDVLEVIEKFNNMEEVKKDIQKRKEIYLKLIEDKEVEIDFFSLSLDEKFIEDKIKKAKELYVDNEKQNDVHLAYQLGLIDGLKVKDKK